MASADPLEERALSRIGMVLRGKYRLDRVLGMGGMAVVYKATHRNQAEFAVKMLHPELSLNADIRQRFLREGYASNSVKHTGVVLVVDDDVAEDGAAFLVMELLDGGGCEDLWSACGGRIPLDAACAVGVELLDVLGAAHDKGIVHRDIKPANLFVLRDGTLKVLDFGIARVRDTMTGGSAHATGTGVMLGTPAFMAPEQALGKTNDIDARVDIWAAGATLFTLLSGTTVHEAETTTHLLVKLATQPARSIATVVPGLPPAIVVVVDRALAFEKDHRWPSAVAMRDALLAASRGSFGDFAPRAALARLVASRAASRNVADGAQLGATQGDSGASYQPPRFAAPTPVNSGAAVANPSGSGNGIRSVLTASPVTQDSPPGSRTRAPSSRVVVGLGALVVLTVAIAAGLAVRGGHKAVAAIGADTMPPASAPPASGMQASTASAATLLTPSAMPVAIPSVQDVASKPPESSPTEVRATPPPVDSARVARPVPHRQELRVPGPTAHPAPAAPGAPTSPAPAAPAPPPRPTADPLDGRQ